MVQSRHLTPESLIRAMKQGNLYASSGVKLATIEYSPEHRSLMVSVQPEADAEYVIEFIGTREGAWRNDTKEVVPKLDVEQVGVVLARHEGISASYSMQDDELYVRARITSDQQHPNPSFADQKIQAWTQPVGWEHRIE